MRPTVASWLSVISTQGDAAGPRSATAGASSTLTGPLMASLSQPAASGPAGPAAIPPGCLGECPPEPLRHAGGGDRCGGVQPDGWEHVPERISGCLLYTSPSPRDGLLSR